MPKFLVEASYTAEGTRGLLKDGGTGRRTAIEADLKSLGGKLETLYFAFGKRDVIVIFDVPDNVSAATVALAVNSAGTAVTRTTPLLTPEEIDRAAKKTIQYRGPGKRD